MAQTTENYGLYLEDSGETKFKDWREKMNGTVDSNMKKIDTALAGKLPLSGGNLTGPLTVQAPSAASNPATKKYVDDLIGDISTILDTVNGEVV